ncbi:hypothetical protein F4604DRAFT_1529969, partial [Suillus subluteus]
SLKWTRSQLFLRTRMLHQQRSVNSWNTFVRAKLNEANEDCEQGDRIKLTRFIAENKDELTHAHVLLSSAEKRVYNTQVLEARKKNQVARANPKAILHDVNATFTSMDREARILSFFSGWLSVLILAQRDFMLPFTATSKDLSELKMFFTEKAEKFVKEKDIRHRVNMNYTNYERNIVEHCGVAL